MTMPADGAGRVAGGSVLPVPGPYAAKLRAAGRAAPAWYAACVAALGALAAVALVGVPAGAGLALLGVALCGLGVRRADGRYGLALWVLAVTPSVRAADWVWIPCLIGAATLASLAATIAGALQRGLGDLDPDGVAARATQRRHEAAGAAAEVEHALARLGLPQQQRAAALERPRLRVGGGVVPERLVVRAHRRAP